MSEKGFSSLFEIAQNIGLHLRIYLIISFSSLFEIENFGNPTSTM